MERPELQRGTSTAIILLSLALLATACSRIPTYGFPVEEGDIGAGRQAFIDHQCNRCHSVAGVDLPPYPGASTPLLELGGPTSRVKAYSELVSSIINPNHRISERYRERLPAPAPRQLESPMPATHIETMTVRQLIDIVAFLDSRYVLIDDYDYDFAGYDLADEE